MAGVEGGECASSMLPQRTVEDALYRAVLERWQRCHGEGKLIAAELRAAEREQRQSVRTAGLRRIMRFGQASTLQDVLRRWALAAVMIELESARTAERAVRAEFQSEVQQWRRREEQDLALVSALHAGTSSSLDVERAPAVVVAPPVAAYTPAQPARRHPPPPLPPPPQAQPQTPATTAAHGLGSQQPPSRRPLGSHAERLLSAWRRESSAAG
jgi:AcrR family transcriptional regulator